MTLRLTKKMLLAVVLMFGSSSMIGFAADQTVENSNGDLSAGSFRQVVRDAQSGDVIRFAESIDTILLDGSAVNLAATNLTIGEPNRTVTLDGNGLHPILRLLHAVDDTEIRNLVFQNALNEHIDTDLQGRVQEHGGALLHNGGNDKTLTIYGSSFDGNRINLSASFVNGRGAAVYADNIQSNYGGDNYLVIDSSSFRSNQVVVNGLEGDNENHYADTLAFGGAVWTAAIATLNNVEFVDNLAYAKGGGPDPNGNSPASAGGGALFSYGITIDSSLFSGNQAVAVGGTGLVDTGAYAQGGALFVNTLEEITIRDSLFEHNLSSATGGTGLGTGQQVYATGGAMTLFGPTIVTLTDTSFLSNTVVANQTTLAQGRELYAWGGAINVEALYHDSVINLTATTGNQTVFRGNREIENRLTDDGNTEEIVRANSIRFVRYEGNPIIYFNVATEEGALVALDDPVASTIDTTLKINVAGEGEFRWGGRNLLGKVSETAIHFRSGTVTLSPDFSIEIEEKSMTPHDLPLEIHFAENVNLRLNLTDRNASSAMFVDPDSLTVDNTKLTAYSYSLDSVAGEKYLVTDVRDGVDASNFVMNDDPNGWFRTTVSTEDDHLYVSVDNSRAIAPIVNHRNANVQSAYRSGGMNEAYLNALKLVDPSDWNDIFTAVRNDAQRLVPEAVATQTVVARDWSRDFTRMLWQSRDESGRSAQCAPTACGPCGSSKGDRRHVWGGYVGNHTEQFVDDGYYGYKANLNGVMVGLDTALNRKFELGTYFVYGDGRTRSDALASRIETDAYQFGLYGTWKPNRKWSIRTDISYGHFENDSERWNAFGPHTGSFNQNLFNFGLIAVRDIRLGKHSRLSPYGGLRYIYLDQDSVQEYAIQGLPTSISGMNGESLESIVGTSLAFDLRQCTATFYADWRHEFCDSGFRSRASFDGVTQIFNLNSTARQRDSADLGFDLKTSWKGRRGRLWTAHTGYAANLTKHYQSQAYYAMLGLKF